MSVFCSLVFSPIFAVLPPTVSALFILATPLAVLSTVFSAPAAYLLLSRYSAEASFPVLAYSAAPNTAFFPALKLSYFALV